MLDSGVGHGIGHEVVAVWRYPVKSMGGERLDAVDVRPGGIVGDRRWAVRDLATGRVASAKRPRPFGALLDWSAATRDDGTVVVTAPDGATWEAGDPGLDAALSSRLGVDVALDEVEPGADAAYDSEWPEIPGTTLSDTEATFATAMMTDKVAFVDLAALHIVLEESRRRLEAWAGVPTPVERFRPNLVVRAVADHPPPDGGDAEALVELGWVDVSARLGEVPVTLTAPAPRCVMTTLDQGGLGPAREVLAVLAERARVSSEFGTFACFGAYAEVAAPGRVAIGDRLVAA